MGRKLPAFKFPKLCPLLLPMKVNWEKLVKGKGKGKGTVHYRTGHEGPEGGRSKTLPLISPLSRGGQWQQRPGQILITSGGMKWDGNFEVNFGKPICECCKANLLLLSAQHCLYCRRKPLRPLGWQDAGPSDCLLTSTQRFGISVLESAANSFLYNEGR